MTTDNPLAVLGRLGEIEERAKAATPGPWHSDGVGVWRERVGGGGGYDIADCDSEWREGDGLPADPDFIAAARTDLPVLVAACREMLEALEPFVDIGVTMQHWAWRDDELLTLTTPAGAECGAISIGALRRAATLVKEAKPDGRPLVLGWRRWRRTRG